MEKKGIITKTITARPTPEQLAEAYKPWTPENDARMAAERKKGKRSIITRLASHPAV